MTEPFALVGGHDGTLVLLSALPDLAEQVAVRQGKVVSPVAAVDEPVALLHGVNLLSGSVDDLAPTWRLEQESGRATSALNANRAWTVHDRDPWVLAFDTDAEPVAAVLSDPFFGESIPVLAGDVHEVRARTGVQQADARLQVEFLDGAGAVVAESAVPLSPGFRGGDALRDYEEVCLRAVAPPSARSARLRIHFDGHRPDAAAPYARAAVFVFDCAVVARPETPHPLRPARAMVPWLVDAARRERGVRLYSCPIELGVASGAEFASVIPLGDPDATGTVWRPPVTSGSAGRIVDLHNGMLRLEVERVSGPLTVWVDGEYAAEVPSRSGRTARTARLDARWLDGAGHVVGLRDETGCYVYDRTHLVLPHVVTPWATLQRDAPLALPGHLDPAAGYRYRALRNQLACADVPDQVAQVAHVHRVLETGSGRNRDFRTLRFPPAPDPEVSVVVRAHDEVAVTYQCLAALLLAAGDATFEVIVVDDRPDGASPLEGLVEGVTVVRPEDGQRAAVNAGAACARGEFVAVLDADTEVTYGWLDDLTDTFTRFDAVGLAGARVLDPDGRLRAAGGTVGDAGELREHGRGENPFDPRFGCSRQVDVATTAVMVRRSVWEEVGGLARTAHPAYAAEVDLAAKVRAAGYTTWLCAAADVIRGVRSDDGSDDPAPGRVPDKAPGRVPAHLPAPAPDQTPEQATHSASRRVVGRVLFVEMSTPRPDRDAGSYAAIQEMRLIQALGYQVTFVPFNLAYLGDYTRELQRMGVEVVHTPFAVSVKEFLMQRGAEFDAIYVMRYNVAELILADVAAFAPQAKVLFCNIDLHFLRLQRSARLTRDEEAWAESLKIRDAELEVMRQVDVILSYNEVEHSVILSHDIRDAEIVTCPWVVDTAPKDAVAPFGSREGIAFLGGYSHPPNIEAVDFFLDEVLPRLRERLPGVRFNIYGSAMPDRFRELADEVINPVGYVGDLDEVHQSNRLFVAPLLSGAGIKGKVLGALSQGLPCVLSPIAAEGTGVRDGIECVLASSPDEWVAALERLYLDEEAWTAMSDQARLFTANHYSFARGRELMRAAFEVAGLPTAPAPR